MMYKCHADDGNLQFDSSATVGWGELGRADGGEEVDINACYAHGMLSIDARTCWTLALSTSAL